MVNEIKEESEGDVIKKYELEKKIKITEEMKKMNCDELKEQLIKMMIKSMKHKEML